MLAFRKPVVGFVPSLINETVHCLFGVLEAP